MFTDKDKKNFNRSIDVLASIGEKIGTQINKRGIWVFKTVIIGLAILTFGFSFLIGSIIKKSLGMKG